jgi:putative methyltransferase (TIGR04325 family)
MHGLKSFVKSRIPRAIELLPYGRDIVLHLTRNRRGISYRGVFDSWGQATQEASKGKSAEYDVINANKADNPEREKQRLDIWFRETDYPLLYWLSRTIDEKCTVLDLGGSLGHFFYSIQHKLDLPKTLKYVIAELPSAVAYGAELARERKEERLSFIDSSTLASVLNFDIFMTAGTLQYMPKELPQIIDEFDGKPRHVLLHNLPIHAEKGFYTVQNLGLCEVPYRIYSFASLCEEMKSRGYELVDQWVNDRKIEIPFHRSAAILGYGGFYFRNSN